MTAPAALPDFAAVAAAAARLEGVAVRTPLLSSAELDRRIGRRVLLKAETLQLGGAFKFRGAYNRLSQLDAAGRRAGVVAFSSGNHAQGVALAARRIGCPALIVMPADAPAMKLRRTREYGAEVVTYDRRTESREVLAARLAQERGAALVPSFDDPDIIAGQGTCGLEFVEQARAAGVRMDAVLAPAGGGGLIAGMALAFEELSARTRLYAAEPAGFDDHVRSLAAGERLANAPGARSVCDALLAPEPGELTFAINRDRLVGGVVVDDAEVARAIAFAFQELKLVLEPGGAVALAALLAGRAPEGDTLGIVLSGGNVDGELFARCLAEWPHP